VAAEVALDRVLVETDSPYPFAGPLRASGTNRPTCAYGGLLAGLLGIGTEECAEAKRRENAAPPIWFWPDHGLIRGLVGQNSNPPIAHVRGGSMPKSAKMVKIGR